MIKKPEDNILTRLKGELKIIKDKGWIDSFDPTRRSDKDVGLTLERELGILLILPLYLTFLEKLN